MNQLEARRARRKAEKAAQQQLVNGMIKSFEYWNKYGRLPDQKRLTALCEKYAAGGLSDGEMTEANELLELVS